MGVNSERVWCWLTQVVLDQGPRNVFVVHCIFCVRLFEGCRLDQICYPLVIWGGRHLWVSSESLAPHTLHYGPFLYKLMPVIAAVAYLAELGLDIYK